MKQHEAMLSLARGRGGSGPQEGQAQFKVEVEGRSESRNRQGQWSPLGSRVFEGSACALAPCLLTKFCLPPFEILKSSNWQSQTSEVSSSTHKGRVMCSGQKNTM